MLVARRTTDTYYLHRQAANLVRLAQKDIRHYIFNRACYNYAKALKIMAVAVYYGVKDHNCVKRDLLREYLRIVVDKIDEEHDKIKARLPEEKKSELWVRCSHGFAWAQPNGVLVRVPGAMRTMNRLHEYQNELIEMFQNYITTLGENDRKELEEIISPLFD